MDNIFRATIIALLATAVSSVVSFPSHAAWPERPVTLVVPFAAGGVTDTLARLTAERLHARFKQTFLVENVPGASGTVAAQRVARAEPDGYTLFFASPSQIAIAPYTHTLNFDPIKAFSPISIIAVIPFVITTSKTLGVNSLSEFIAYVKARPGQVTFGSAGFGTLTHLSAAVFLKNAGLDMIHVPYRGVAPAFQDLVAGHIAMVSATPAEVLPFLEKGGIKLLAVTSERRSTALPDVPLLSDTVNTPPVVTWSGLLAPAGTPQPILDALSREIMAAEQDPSFLAQLARLGVDPVVHAPAEFARMIADESERWRRILRDIGIRPPQ